MSSHLFTLIGFRYDIAMGINVMGARHVLNFAKKCTNIKMLLHVSTGNQFLFPVSKNDLSYISKFYSYDVIYIY